MKKFIIALLFMPLAASLYAQNKTDTSTAISDLYISSAPGLILAGKSTTSVERPTTPRAFAVSLINLVQGGSVEVTPYWWFHHPSLSYESYMQQHFVLLQTLNFSVSDFKTDSNFSVAPGIRTQVARFYSKGAIAKLKAKKAEIVNALTTLPVDQKKITQLQGQLDSLSAKGIIALELAGAVLGTSSGNPLRNLDFNTTGVWANLSWSPIAIPVGFVGMARYLWGSDKTATSTTFSRYLDIGAQANYITSKWNAELEYVFRKDILSHQTYHRVAGTLTYVINQNVSLEASYGKGLAQGQRVATLFGLNFGIDRSK